jgi:hypothetical protein
VIGEVIRTWENLWKVCMEVKQALGKFREVFLVVKNTKTLPISIRYRINEFAAVFGEVSRTWDSYWRVCKEVIQALGKFKEVF